MKRTRYKMVNGTLLGKGGSNNGTDTATSLLFVCKSAAALAAIIVASVVDVITTGCMHGSLQRCDGCSVCNDIVLRSCCAMVAAVSAL
jgi:hypothetical protein